MREEYQASVKNYRATEHPIGMSRFTLEAQHSQARAVAPAAPGTLNRPTMQELRTKMERERRKVRSEIEEAWRLGADHKERWRTQLVEIDLVAPDARDLVRKLRDEVDRFKAEFPYEFGWTDLNSAYLLKSELANISLALVLLECACSDYRIWFAA